MFSACYFLLFVCLNAFHFLATFLCLSIVSRSVLWVLFAELTDCQSSLSVSETGLRGQSTLIIITVNCNERLAFTVPYGPHLSVHWPPLKENYFSICWTFVLSLLLYMYFKLLYIFLIKFKNTLT